MDARTYHRLTKHSLLSVRSGPHGLDWPNQPTPFKDYLDLAPQPLPRSLARGKTPALEAIAGRKPTRGLEDRPDRAALGRLLYYSLGIIRSTPLGDGRKIGFRAAPCTGALYHVDAYLVTGELRDLAAGVHHFDPRDFALRTLRAGDFRGVLARATGNEAALTSAPVTIVLASTYWRNAWKYRARAYRHVYWDGGAIIAHLDAQAAADGWRFFVATAFEDAEVERLVGLDPTKEGAFALVSIGGASPVPSPPAIEPISFRTARLSPETIDYPEIREMHAASSLPSGEEARRWRDRAAKPPASPMPELQPAADPPTPPLEEVILARGSARQFHRRPISRAALESLLRAAAAPLECDSRADPRRAHVDLYVLVLAVEGLEAGRYRFDANAGRLDRIGDALDRKNAAFLGLGQELPGDAAVDIFAVADLERVTATLGDRGYRAASLDGGISGGRAYLAAYALGLGATGLTFFDDEAAAAFGLDPERYGVMFLTAVGVPATKPKRVEPPKSG